MNLTDKQKVVEELHERFAKATVAILTDYKGLDVTTLNALRKQLREVNVEYRVVKNTLLVRASEETDAALIKEQFKGPSAIALSYDDPVAPAKVLSKFAEGNDKLQIKTGVMGGRVLNPMQIKALADLPSREILLGQLLSVFNNVPAGFVRTLNAIPAQLMNVLQAIREKKEAEAA